MVAPTLTVGVSGDAAGGAAGVCAAAWAEARSRAAKDRAGMMRTELDMADILPGAGPEVICKSRLRIQAAGCRIESPIPKPRSPIPNPQSYDPRIHD